MYAQCPECLTIYSLDAATVAQAHGTVACGHCGATFDTLATLTEELPPEPFDSLPLHAASPAPPMLMMAVFRPQTTQPNLFDQAPGASGAPSFARRRRASRRGHPLRWAMGCLALALLLAGQLAWAERATLTANDSIRPWLQRGCDLVGCRLPKVRDIDKLQLISRDIRPHPSVPGALIISATLRNDADFTQPFPVVSITLSDLDNNRIAMRRFRPSEYIHDAATRAAGLPPGGTAALVFEVRDPGKNAVAFQFGFQ
jgi:predicted Zn finger-like uncharacterized protein